MAERRAVRRRPADEEPRQSRRPAGDLPDEDEYEDEYDDTGDDSSESAGARSRSRPSQAGGGLSAADAAAAGLRQIIQLTGKEPEGVTGVEPSDEGWVVGVEVVEDRRVPSSADILATYQAEIDSEGDLASYRRVRRYPRAKGDGGEGL